MSGSWIASQAAQWPTWVGCGPTGSDHRHRASELLSHLDSLLRASSKPLFQGEAGIDFLKVDHVESKNLSHMSAFMAASLAMSKGIEGRSEKASGQSFWRGWSEFLPSEPFLYKENQDGVCQRPAHFLRQANCGAPGAIGVPEGW
jgi:hypothetical protein